MSQKLSALDKRILNRLQSDIPFTARPWKAMAKELYIEEGRFLKRVGILKKKGIIRRISAAFSPAKINFVSTLAAIKAAPHNIGKIAKEINSYPEVTHNYRRTGEYDLWFTLIAKNKKKITAIIRRLEKNKSIEKISEFPAIKLFKINVRFTC